MSTTVVDSSTVTGSLADTAPTRPIESHPIRRKRITVAMVRAALVDIAARNPRRVDRRDDHRVDAELPTRYAGRGGPACLVAQVLTRLGFTLGQLKALDAEHPVGELFTAGVRVTESRHPALRRLDDNAKALLQWVQDKQDAGHQWGRIVADAWRPRSVWKLARFDRRHRPWLYG